MASLVVLATVKDIDNHGTYIVLHTVKKCTIFSCVASSFVAVYSPFLGSVGICGHFDD